MSEKVTKTFFIEDLLSDILMEPNFTEDLIGSICKNECVPEIRDSLLKLDHNELARQLIEGVIMKKDTLTSFMSQHRYSLRPCIISSLPVMLRLVWEIKC